MILYPPLKHNIHSLTTSLSDLPIPKSFDCPPSGKRMARSVFQPWQRIRKLPGAVCCSNKKAAKRIENSKYKNVTKQLQKPRKAKL